MTRIWWKVLGVIAMVTAIALASWLVIAHVTGPVEEPDPLVRAAAQALREVSVKGTVVTVVRTPQSEREYRAEVHRGEGRTVLRYLDGPAEGMAVHRQRGAIWVEGREAEAGRGTRRAEVGERSLETDLLRRNWTFRTAGTRRVAGRSTTLVQGTGPGGSLTLAVEHETGFPLYMSRRGPDGVRISESTWLDVDFSVEPPPKLDLPEKREERRRTRTTPEEAREAVEFTVLEPTWLPDNWELRTWYLLERPHRPAAATVEARYTDGLRTLTIMQRSAVRPDADEDRPDREAYRRERRQYREEWRSDREDRPDGPAMRDHFGQGEPGWRQLRGIGGDASRRVIDDTIVIVMGPLSEQERERILDGMRPPS